mmetsp:Transcript_40578/g.93268  ORF Transcript_40578/g.93268 Transcript_40578/m.93268 type:complete len:206 (-) Transcript_40578:3480-4097(-)
MKPACSFRCRRLVHANSNSAPSGCRSRLRSYQKAASGRRGPSSPDTRSFRGIQTCAWLWRPSLVQSKLMRCVASLASYAQPHCFSDGGAALVWRSVAPRSPRPQLQLLRESRASWHVDGTSGFVVCMRATRLPRSSRSSREASLDVGKPTNGPRRFDKRWRTELLAGGRGPSCDSTFGVGAPARGRCSAAHVEGWPENSRRRGVV